MSYEEGVKAQIKRKAAALGYFEFLDCLTNDEIDLVLARLADYVTQSRGDLDQVRGWLVHQYSALRAMGNFKFRKARRWRKKGETIRLAPELERQRQIESTTCISDPSERIRELGRVQHRLRRMVNSVEFQSQDAWLIRAANWELDADFSGCSAENVKALLE